MKYDIIAKFMMEQGKESIVHRLLHIHPASIELMTMLPNEFPDIVRSDFPIRIRYENGKEEILLIEFQTYWKQESVWRHICYTMRARLTYQLPVRPIMFLFCKSNTADSVYQDECITFRFELVKLWEQNGDEIVQSNDFNLFLFLPVMDCEEKTILSAEEIIYNTNELDKQSKSSLLSALSIFSGLRNKKLVETLLQRSKDMALEESPVYQMILEKGELKGKLEGKLEGIREGLLWGLEIKFGEESLKLKEALDEIQSIEQLYRLETVLKQSSTLFEFESYLTNY